MISPSKDDQLNSLPTILIVDDREYDRILYREYLGEFNYEFHELDDGDLIMEFLQSTVPDLIILDWQMLRVNGLEVLKTIKNNRKFQYIPIIIITGQEKTAVLEQAFNYGANDFLVKPVKETELKVRIINLLKIQEELVQINKEKIAVQELNSIIADQNQRLKELTEKSANEIELSRNKVANLIKHINAELKDLKNRNSIQVADKRILDSIVGDINSFISVDENNTSYHGDNDFNQKLLKLSPNLTSLDLQHCTLLRKNMSNDEIAKILFVETKSLQTKRYRLKKKLGLEKEVSLRKFLIEM